MRNPESQYLYVPKMHDVYWNDGSAWTKAEMPYDYVERVRLDVHGEGERNCDCD